MTYQAAASINLLGDRILIRELPPESPLWIKKRTGVLKGEVVKLGTGRWLKKACKRLVSSVKEGDVIFFSHMAGQPLFLQDEGDYRVICENDVLGVEVNV